MPTVQQAAVDLPVIVLMQITMVFTIIKQV